MDKTALVEEDIDQGAELIEALDDAGFGVHSALWLYSSEQCEWRLVIATPLVDEDGPLEAYRKIDKILRRKGMNLALSLQDISLVSPTKPLIQALRKALKTGKGISGIRFSRNAFDGFYIDDAHVYRVQ